MMCKIYIRAKQKPPIVEQGSTLPGGRTRAASKLTTCGCATRLMSKISFLKLSRSCRVRLCNLNTVYPDIMHESQTIVQVCSGADDHTLAHVAEALRMYGEICPAACLACTDTSPFNSNSFALEGSSAD